MLTRRIAVGTGVAAVLAVSGTAVAVATDNDDQAVRGKAGDATRAAALRYTHGGTAGIVERDTEHGATWGVEVTRSDGSAVDVRLDADLKLIEITSNADG